MLPIMEMRIQKQIDNNIHTYDLKYFLFSFLKKISNYT